MTTNLDDSPEFAVLRQNLAVDRHNAQATGTTDVLESELRRLRRRSRFAGYRARLKYPWLLLPGKED